MIAGLSCSESELGSRTDPEIGTGSGTEAEPGAEAVPDLEAVVELDAGVEPERERKRETEMEAGADRGREPPA